MPPRSSVAGLFIKNTADVQLCYSVCVRWRTVYLLEQGLLRTAELRAAVEVTAVDAVGRDCRVTVASQRDVTPLMSRPLPHLGGRRAGLLAAPPPARSD